MKVVEFKDDRVLLAADVLDQLKELKPTAFVAVYVVEGEIGSCYAGFHSAPELLGAVEMGKLMIAHELV
jgi:hypothetical protein